LILHESFSAMALLSLGQKPCARDFPPAVALCWTAIADFAARCRPETFHEMRFRTGIEPIARAPRLPFGEHVVLGGLLIIPILEPLLNERERRGRLSR